MQDRVAATSRAVHSRSSWWLLHSYARARPNATLTQCSREPREALVTRTSWLFPLPGTSVPEPSHQDDARREAFSGASTRMAGPPAYPFPERSFPANLARDALVHFRRLDRPRSPRLMDIIASERHARAARRIDRCASAANTPERCTLIAPNSPAAPSVVLAPGGCAVLKPAAVSTRQGGTPRARSRRTAPTPNRHARDRGRKTGAGDHPTRGYKRGGTEPRDRRAAGCRATPRSCS
jgi:hypothetical protein